MAESKVFVDLNLQLNRLKNAVFELRSSAPSSPVEGQFYYNTVDKMFYVFNGSVWISMGGVVDPIDGGQF